MSDTFQTDHSLYNLLIIHFFSNCCVALLSHWHNNVFLLPVHLAKWQEICVVESSGSQQISVMFGMRT